MIELFKDTYKADDAHAARILGVSRTALVEWRLGRRAIPAYIQRSIDLHLNIPRLHQQRIRTKHK